MVILFGVWVGFTSNAEHQNNPAVAHAGITRTVGNTEGKEVRFGDTTVSALWCVVDFAPRRVRQTPPTTPLPPSEDSDS